MYFISAQCVLHIHTGSELFGQPCPGIRVRVNPVRINQSMALSKGASNFVIYLPYEHVLT